MTCKILQKYMCTLFLVAKDLTSTVPPVEGLPLISTCPLSNIKGPMFVCRLLQWCLWGLWSPGMWCHVTEWLVSDAVRQHSHLKTNETNHAVTQHHIPAVAYPGIFFGGGVQKIQLRTEDRENGDLGAVAP